jgi:ketosteroid isomerase-like protein
MDEMQTLLIERACSRLVLLAAAHADHHRAAEFAALFAPDALLSRPNAEALHGREAIREAYAQRPASRISRHVVTNICVDVLSTTEARAISTVLLWAGSADDEPGPRGRPAQAGQVLGEFDDRFVLTPEGWRIVARQASFLLHG